MQFIEDTWFKYDKDGNGELDKEETRKFMNEAIKSINPSYKDSDEEFEKVFNLCDADNSGYIDKEEMNLFIKTLLSK